MDTLVLRLTFRRWGRLVLWGWDCCWSLPGSF